MRLTKKDYCGYDISTRKEQRDYTCEEIFDVLQKLGQLEDIEEELGIDLITLLKCKYVYIKKGKKIFKKAVLINIRLKRLVYHVGFIFIKCLPFSKYKKTWALTKEELL